MVIIVKTSVDRIMKRVKCVATNVIFYISIINVKVFHSLVINIYIMMTIKML